MSVDEERLHRLLERRVEDFPINVVAAGEGEHLIVEAGTDRLLIVSYVLVTSAAVELRWKAGTLDGPGKWKSGRMSHAAQGGLAPSGTPRSPRLTLDGGQDLILHVSGATVVGGHGSMVRVREDEWRA